MNRLRSFILSVVATFALLIPGVVGVSTVAAHHCFGHVGTGNVSIAECADAGACLDTAAPNCEAETGDAEARVNDTIRLIVNVFSFIVGVVAVIMIIVAGFKYITSGGDTNNVAGAKNTILYAVVGLVIVALAQVIVRFVLQKATQTTGFISLIG